MGNLQGFQVPEDSVKHEELTDIDQWALDRLNRVIDRVKDSYRQYDFTGVYTLIYSFCNEDLSSIYLDILKDRLYTFAAKSPERRAAQTVLFHIADSLMRLIAPILSFTAEEIFQSLSKNKAGESLQSVHLLDWPVALKAWNSPQASAKLERLLELRPHVLKALEAKRRSGTIGSSLESKVIFQTASPQEFDYLNSLKEILSGVFIVSQVEIKKGGAQEVVIERAEGQKCVRCWNYSVAVGQDKEHPTLCQRCVLTQKLQL